jgi:hypothetical protein
MKELLILVSGFDIFYYIIIVVGVTITNLQIKIKFRKREGA